MRWNYENSEDPNSYICCFCCHVRTGTIVIGIFHMFLNAALLCFVAALFANPDLVNSLNANHFLSQLPTNTTLLDGQLANWTDEKAAGAFLALLASLTLTIFLLFGALRGKANYLLPFFFFQIFDFAMACVSMTRFSRNNAMHEMHASEDGMMMMQSRSYVVGAIIGLALKAYLIGVVWSCYRYLTRFPHGHVKQTGMTPVVGDSEMLLPPKYEDAILTPAYVAPLESGDEDAPPAYSN